MAILLRDIYDVVRKSRRELLLGGVLLMTLKRNEVNELNSLNSVNFRKTIDEEYCIFIDIVMGTFIWFTF